MFGKGTLGRSRTLAFGFLAALWGCGLLGGDRAAEHPKAVAETVFREPGHSLSACLHEEIARSHLDWPESALFFDRDSTIRVTLPTKKGAAHYHLHLIHRVGERTLDTLVMQDGEGSLVLDLSRFDQPEEVVVVSDARRIVEDGTQVLENPRSDSPREVIPTPAYAVSFKLIPVESGMETVLSLQRHRWEIKTESGD